MLQKGVCPYEYMDNLEKFNETLLPSLLLPSLPSLSSLKEDFYSHLNMEDITDADYGHAERFSKDFEIKI